MKSMTVLQEWQFVWIPLVVLLVGLLLGLEHSEYAGQYEYLWLWMTPNLVGVYGVPIVMAEHERWRQDDLEQCFDWLLQRPYSQETYIREYIAERPLMRQWKAASREMLDGLLREVSTGKEGKDH